MRVGWNSLGPPSHRKSPSNNARVTHLGAVQVLVFLQEFIGLLDGHFIVAIIEVIWVEGGGNMGDYVNVDVESHKK